MSSKAVIQQPEDFSYLISEVLENQTQKIHDFIARDASLDELYSLHEAAYDIHVNDQIQLRLVVSCRNFDPIRIETVKIAGFWSDGIVTGRVQEDRSAPSKSIIASLNTSAGGEDLDGITEAEAYVNKGRATTLVAETLVLLERSPSVAKTVNDYKKAVKALADALTEKEQEAFEVKRQKLREELLSNKDLIFVKDTDRLVDAAKAIAVTREFGQATVLAYHDGVTDEVQFEDPLTAVAVYNNSTAKRKMANQYIGKPSRIRSLEREPTAKTRNVSKVSQVDLKKVLSHCDGVFLVRSITDPELIEAIS